jgi:ribosomal protein S18 acetylase RimI-like enzyme
VEAVIRAFRFPEDYDDTLKLWSSAGRGVNLGRSDTLEEIAKKAARDPDLFLVAEKEGRIIGAVIGGYDGRRGLVYHLAVAAEQRAQGLGGSLMDEVERRLREKGCLRVYLLVTNENTAAIRFYEKRGWEEMDLHIFAKNIT